MGLDPQAQRLLAMIGAGRRIDSADLTIAERRRGFADLMRLAGPPPEIGAVDETAVRGHEGWLAARVYTPVAPPSDRWPGLVYFHGGGLVAGSLDTHDALCRALARDAVCKVVAVDYRLAPEHRFPAAVEDAIASLKDVLDRASAFQLDPRRIAVGGDSAGATLAAVSARHCATRAGLRPAFQFLLCPVLDMEPQTASRREYGDGYLLDAGLMIRDLADYAPSCDIGDPSLSPLRAENLAGLPPALIHTAEFDPLRDEGAAYAAKLRRAGVAAEDHCHAGMIHHFYGLTGFIPRARSLLAEIAADLGARLRSQAESTRQDLPV